MKKKLITIIISILVIIILVFGFLRLNQEFYIDYNISIKTEGNFIIYSPFIFINDLSEKEYLNDIKINGDVSISIIILNNNHEPFSNLTKFSYLTNYPFNIKALKIVGNGNAEISFKKYGKYDCHLTLYNVNLSSVGKRVHSIYCEKQINQIISFSIWGEKTGEDIEYWNQQKDIYNLNNGWNKIKISNTGII